MLLTIQRCAIFTSLLILHAPLILAASGKQVELPTCSGELPPNEGGNWPPPNLPLFKFKKGVLITAGHDDYATLQSLCVDDPDSNLPSMGCICTIDHRTLCKERFRWDALADHCEQVCECPNESEEDKQKGFMAKLLGTKSLGRVSIDMTGSSSRKKAFADESERSSSFHGYGSRGDGVPRQRGDVNTPYDNNVCGRGCRDAEECTRFEGVWGCQSLVCMLQGVTNPSFRNRWANGVCVSALTASLGLGKGSNFGLRRRGTLEKPACACNTTYVSTGCCASTDGLVWEGPEMYLGEVVLA